jgi:hypothetical protein
VLARARRRVLVVDSGAPRNAPAAHLHGFLSRDGMPPTDLLAIGRAEVQGYGGTVVAGLDCDLDDHGWVVRGANGATSVLGIWVAGNLANRALS